MNKISITPGENVELLPAEAKKVIGRFLFDPDYDAPGRDELLESYAKILFNAMRDGEAKLASLDRKCSMLRKMFELWLPTITRLKKTYGQVPQKTERS